MRKSARELVTRVDKDVLLQNVQRLTEMESAVRSGKRMQRRGAIRAGDPGSPWSGNIVRCVEGTRLSVGAEMWTLRAKMKKLRREKERREKNEGFQP